MIFYRQPCVIHTHIKGLITNISSFRGNNFYQELCVFQSIGHSEALDYMADVKQHLQAILQGSNQPIGHGNQLSGHGNQLSGHGSQFIGHGNQLSVHGNQPGRPGYQSHVGGHVTGHMTGQHGGSPVSRHSFYR